MEEKDALQSKLGYDMDPTGNASLQGIDNNRGILVDESQDDIRKRLVDLEQLNYNLNIDLIREKRAKRIVEEQLVFAQSSRATQNVAMSIASPGSRSPMPRVMSPSKFLPSPVFTPGKKTRNPSNSSTSSAVGPPVGFKPSESSERKFLFHMHNALYRLVFFTNIPFLLLLY